MKRPREFTRKDYTEIKEFLSIELRKSQKQIAIILYNALLGTFENYVTTEGKFFPKVYVIVYDIRSWKKNSVAKTYTITKDTKGILKLQRSQ